MHKFTVNSSKRDIKITLDNLELQNVIGYEIKSSAVGEAELILKILVNDSKME